MAGETKNKRNKATNLLAMIILFITINTNKVEINDVKLMNLLELFMSLTIRATLIQIRQNFLVVASITHGQ